MDADFFTSRQGALRFYLQNCLGLKFFSFDEPKLSKRFEEPPFSLFLPDDLTPLELVNLKTVVRGSVVFLLPFDASNSVFLSKDAKEVFINLRRALGLNAETAPLLVFKNPSERGAQKSNQAFLASDKLEEFLFTELGVNHFIEFSTSNDSMGPFSLPRVLQVPYDEYFLNRNKNLRVNPIGEKKGFIKKLFLFHPELLLNKSNLKREAWSRMKDYLN